MIDLFDFAGMWKIEKPNIISDLHDILSSSIGSSMVKADATWLNMSWTIYYGHFAMVVLYFLAITNVQSNRSKTAKSNESFSSPGPGWASPTSLTGWSVTGLRFSHYLESFMYDRI